MKKIILFLIMSILCFTFVDATILRDWRFDETSGNIAYDSSTIKNNMTITSGVDIVNGKLEKARDFDASQRGTSTPTTINRYFTIEGWVWHSSTSTSDQHPYSEKTYWGSSPSTTWRERVYLHVFSSTTATIPNRYRVYLRMSSGKNNDYDGVFYTTTTAIPTNQWVHLGMTRNYTSIKLYVNGVNVSTDRYAYVSNIPENYDLKPSYLDAGVNVGWATSSSTYYYNTTVDELRVLDTVLSPAEMYARYKRGLCIYSGFGNWTIQSRDNCTISRNSNLNKNIININGTSGYVKINASVYNFSKFIIPRNSKIILLRGKII